MPVRSQPLHSRLRRAERPEFRQMSDVRFCRNEAVESRDEKSINDTRTWRNGRNRRGCELNDGGGSMASWLSCRADCRRTGGRGHPLRCARRPNALLLGCLCLRTRLFRATMLCPARTLLGRVALARSPCRGLLLTWRGSTHRSGKEGNWRPAMLGGASETAVSV